MTNLNTVEPDIDLANTKFHSDLSILKKIFLAIFIVGLLIFLIAITGPGSEYPFLFLSSSFGLMALGSLLFFYHAYLSQLPGVKNNGLTKSSISARGYLGWGIGVALTSFYIIYYWQEHLLLHWVKMFDPLSELVRGQKSDVWFFYGSLYTFAVVIMGFRAVVKYRHSRYQIVRTCVVVFSQLIFAWLIPSLLAYFKYPEKYVNYFWPLSYKDGFPENFASLWQPNALMKFLFIWTVSLTLIATPVLTYFFGKRWYCSWVCGCGGLANTFGDPWRQLSDKRLVAWKIERVLIYSVLAFVVIATVYIWVIALKGGQLNIDHKEYSLTKWYGFFIGMIFSGVIGTGFYPLLGTRVWCRFGCPQAAILGILQRFFSRFRITTNGGQCISCGNCSKYCEMGIDVRAYAQRGANIVRASCVGCGMCATVCPRGVLNLENGPMQDRINETFSLSDMLEYKDKK